MGSIIMSVAVVAVGVAIGLARGGSIEAIRSVRPSWWGLVVGGTALHAVAENIDIPGASSWAVVGMFALIVGLAANARFRGALIAAFGVTLNLLPLVLNGAVPIRFEALSAAGIISETTERSQITSVGHLFELEAADTRLGFLGDTIPLGVLGSVISIGDLVTFAGMIVIVSNVIASRPRSGLDVDAIFAPEALAEPLDDASMDPARSLAGAEGPTLADLVGVPDPERSDSGVLDVVAEDPVIDITTPRVVDPVGDLDLSDADGAAFDPDDLWADDDSGVRILGPSTKPGP